MNLRTALKQGALSVLCLLCTQVFAQDSPQPRSTTVTRNNANQRGVSATVMVDYVPRVYSKTEVYFSLSLSDFTVHPDKGYHFEGKVYGAEVPGLTDLLNRTSGDFPKVAFDIYHGGYKQGSTTYQISAKNDLGRLSGDGFSFITSELKVKDLSQWTLVAVRLDGFNYDPDPTMWMSFENAIKDYLRAQGQKKKYEDKIRDADRQMSSAETEESLMAARRLYGEASTLSPGENYPKEQIKAIDEKRKTLKEKDLAKEEEERQEGKDKSAKPSSVSASASGKPDTAGEPGSEDTEIETTPAEKSVSQINAERASAFQQEVKENRAAYDAEIAQSKRRAQERSQLYDRSYYAAEAVGDGEENLSNLSRLDGNYASVEELEADFNQKYYAINQEADNLNVARDESLRANTEANFYGSDETSQAIGGALVAVGALVNEARAEREKQEAREALERQKEQKLAEFEARKKAARLAMRRGFLDRFPDGGLPLSSHKMNTKEVYCFSYTLFESTLVNENCFVLVTNVFPVMQYGDGTWPFKSGIVREISALATGQVTIVGYYTSKEMAEKMRTSFMNLAVKSAMKPNDLTYKGKTHSGSGATTDFWGNEQKQKPQQRDDFWDDGKKEKKAVKQDDFWEN